MSHHLILPEGTAQSLPVPECMQSYHQGDAPDSVPSLLGGSVTPLSPAGARKAAFSDAERAKLFVEFQPLVRRLIRQYGDDAELREDLEGEIYYRFHVLLDEYDPARGVPLRAYLVRKLITSIYTYARSQWRRQSHEVSLEPAIEGTDPLGSFDPRKEWDESLMKEQLMIALSEAIQKLPHRQRQVVIWRYYESRPFDEIAEALGICEATARSLLRHGINNLRRQIKHSHFAPG